MESALSSKRNNLILASIIIGLAAILCTIVVSVTFVKVKGFGRTISVTGAAYRPIVSDYAVWEGTVTAAAPSLAAATSKLESAVTTFETFIKNEGFDSAQYSLGTVDMRKQVDRQTQQLLQYTLRQTIKVEKADVNHITRLAQKASVLLEEGLELTISKPRYLFTGLHGLKIDMIKNATENAKLRAQQLAESTGRSVGAPVSAKVGIFQIRPRHSQAVSSMGISDVSSIEKEIVSTVHVSFLIE